MEPKRAAEALYVIILLSICLAVCQASSSSAAPSTLFLASHGLFLCSMVAYALFVSPRCLLALSFGVFAHFALSRGSMSLPLFLRGRRVSASHSCEDLAAPLAT